MDCHMSQEKQRLGLRLVSCLAAFFITLAPSLAWAQQSQRDPITQAIGNTLAGLFILVVGRWIFSEKLKRDALPKIVSLAAEGKTAEICKLLEEGVSPDEAGPSGETALMLAVKNDHFETAKLLISRGADVAKKTHRGNSAADIATKHASASVVALLNEAPHDQRS